MQTKFNCKAVEVTEAIEKVKVRRNKNLLDEVKKHSRTSPDVQFKEFSLTKQKTRPRMDYEWIGKTISKKRLKTKKTENQWQNAACKQKTTCEKWKFGSNKKQA